MVGPSSHASHHRPRPRAGRRRTALHRDDDPLHFCLAPTTAGPRPCPVRSPGILRAAREIARVIGEHARTD
ncbi:hypothetical protein GCM10019016_133420 [Streptomyces prasinosporus]|uniref:Cytochrome P450 n=1 Tax=Streptomyces prasinosporus TaxID=68256 RepID=A0ABP6UEN5_9ACTN